MSMVSGTGNGGSGGRRDGPDDLDVPSRSEGHWTADVREAVHPTDPSRMIGGWVFIWVNGPPPECLRGIPNIQNKELQPGEELLDVLGRYYLDKNIDEGHWTAECREIIPPTATTRRELVWEVVWADGPTPEGLRHIPTIQHYLLRVEDIPALSRELIRYHLEGNPGMDPQPECSMTQQHDL